VERLSGLCILKCLIISLLNLQNTSLPCQNSAVSKEHVDNHPLALSPDSPCRFPHPRACYVPTHTHAPHRLPCFPANTKLCKLLSTRVQQVAYLPYISAHAARHCLMRCRTLAKFHRRRPVGLFCFFK
jgi:hypothetical protein